MDFLMDIPIELWLNRDIVIAALSVDANYLGKAGNALRDDPEIIRRAVKSNPCAIKHASERLKKNPEFSGYLNTPNCDQ